ncbi:hypothetical protein SpCBS45565_g00071 [Spizellomyces sp. 'palustris']|nr:hypothetical protein SpCBS45565_g00071 [Spizellomyces sp. 'palustris']
MLPRASQRGYSSTEACLRRRVTLLPQAQRLAKFGTYELILPSPANLNGEILRQERLHVPAALPRPEYDPETGQPTVFLSEPHLKAGEELEGVRKACKLARHILELAKTLAIVGTTTADIDRIVHEEIIKHGAYPSPLGYIGFPRSICTSINNVICHGIPDRRALKEGDLVNFDVTVYLDGFHGDTSETVLIGDVDEKGELLTLATKEAMEIAINVCKPGVPLNMIGKVISEYARKKGYSSSRDFCGHGIGRQFHEPPMIFHYENNDPGVMEEGMTFTIEPMLCQGTAEYVKWPDNWTVVTQDGGRSAQFEHTVLIVRDGVEILT